MQLNRWMRRTLRGYGIFQPFSALVSPRHVKVIHVSEGAGAEVSVERTLVYLQRPEAADLWDLVPLAEGEFELHESPDSRVVLRTATSKGTIVHWQPHEPIVPYGLHVHKHGWTSPGALDEAALYTHFRCETRTGVAVLELSTTKTFEAGVAFRWPMWRRLLSIQALVRHALEQLESAQGERPEVLEDGARLRWTLVSPTVGERYVCVAFHPDGMELWHKRLAANTLPARMRQLVRSVTSF
jgi:hypothetical protein